MFSKFNKNNKNDKEQDEIKPKKEISLPALPPGPHEMYLPYSAWRAQGRFRYKIRQEMNLAKELKKGLLLMGIYVAIIIFVIPALFPGTVFQGYLYMCMNFLLYAYALLITFPLLTAPTNIQVGKEGIRLHWLTFLGQYASPWISFDEIDYIAVSKFKRGYYKSEAIDLYIDKSRLSAKARNALTLIAPTLWCMSFGNVLKLRLDIAAITHEADLPLFLRALKNLVPPEKIDPLVLKLEEEKQSFSFTKLWLDSLDGGNRLGVQLGPLSPGESVYGGRFEIINRLATGGQAVTYLALEKMEPVENQVENPTAQERQVVLKEFVLPVRGGIEIRTRALQNVEHEARLLEKLDSPLIVKFLDCFIDGPRAYLVLEYIDGKSLRSRVQKDGPLEEKEVIRLAVEMCTVLEYMHGMTPPLLHRDFTPENLLQRANGGLALIDFNVAEQLETKETRTMVGKHCYVPPEQFRGKATTQSDIYAMGCTLHWLLTGQDPEPISASHPAQINTSVSSELDTLVALATAPDTTRRYQTVREINEALSRLA